MQYYCRKCGKELTQELSTQRGYGPTCYEKHLEDVKKLQLGLNFDSRFHPSMTALEKHKIISELLK